MKKLHTAVAVIGILALGSAAWWYQHRGASPTPMAGKGSGTAVQGGVPKAAGGPAPVEVGAVVLMDIEDDAQAVGELRSRQGVMLRPEVSGRVQKLGFVDGQRVRKGQLLVQLDDALTAAQLKQAEAQASIARTNLQRNRELLAEKFVSTSAVDQTAAALEVADAQVALARAQLERMRILAPFDGQAGIRAVDVGDYVGAGANLVSVEDNATMWLDFRLPERYVARLKPGQAVEARLDALPEKAFQGRIDAVDALLDADGRSLRVRARLPNTAGELRAGMFARARVVFDVRKNATLVPEEALVPQGGKQYLVKVVDGPDGRPHSQRLEARVGVRLPGRAEILDGLSAGDRVVRAGQARLLRPESMPLQIVDVESPGGAASSPGRKAPAKPVGKDAAGVTRPARVATAG